MLRSGHSCQILEAMDDNSRKKYAIKALQPKARDDRTEIATLKFEYDVGVKLDHPNIVKVYEFSDEKGYPYLVLEFCNGGNLKQYVRQGLDTLAYRLENLLVQCADSLAYMHEQGWLHRDIKPDNYMLLEDPADTIKLIDFTIAFKIKSGIGKLLGGKPKVQGTRSYMSPEQIRGEHLGPRADIYSFGCMIYELISGKPPFTGTTEDELLQRHLRSAVPSLQAKNADVTNQFAEFCMSLLAKEADKRPESMRKVQEFIQSTQIFKTPPQPPASITLSAEEEPE